MGYQNDSMNASTNESRRDASYRDDFQSSLIIPFQGNNNTRSHVEDTPAQLPPAKKLKSLMQIIFEKDNNENDETMKLADQNAKQKPSIYIEETDSEED